MANFSITDQATLTDVVKLPLEKEREGNPTLGDRIAPLKPVQSTAVKVRVSQAYAFGLGQFKAPGATPPLFKPKATVEERIIELAQLDEVERIDEMDWQKLNASDPETRNSMGLDLVDRARILALRNERLTEWMRFQALFNGNLAIQYKSTGQELFIDYGYLPTHRVNASVPWATTSTSDPIADMNAVASLIGDDSGFYGVNFHMNRKTFNLINQSAKVKSYLTSTSRSLLLPTTEDIRNLMDQEANFIVDDSGYRPESSGTSQAIVKYIPDNKVLVTTDYRVGGMNIADTPDGLVAITTDWNKIELRQGVQSEVLIDQVGKNHFFRQASSRIVRINMPECIAVLTVG